MKHTTLSLFAVSTLLISACSNWTQILYTSSDFDAIQEDSSFYFENDTVKVQYAFWADKGIMSFAITNIHDKPIYVDWKKSSYVNGGVKNNYYVEQTVSNTVGASGGYTYRAYGVPYATFGAFSGNTVAVQEERITFIPPRSRVVLSRRYLIQDRHLIHENYSAKSDRRGVSEFKTDIPAERAKVHFRNFITYSTTENFAKEQYVDHEFYVSKILTVKTKDFWIKDYSNARVVEYSTKYADPTGFYIQGVKKSQLFR